MMKDYKKIVEKQHAPESLIRSTLEKAEQEEKKKKVVKKKYIPYVGSTVVVAAAVLFFVLFPHESVYYNRTTQSLQKGIIGEGQMEQTEAEVMSRGEVQDYIGGKKEGWLEEYSLTRAFRYGEGEEKLTVLSLEVKGYKVLVRLSDREGEIGKELRAGKGSKIGGKEVWFGEGEGRLLAVGETESENNRYYCIMAVDMKKADFEKFLKNFLDF